jgi:hypothetical protein
MYPWFVERKKENKMPVLKTKKQKTRPNKSKHLSKQKGCPFRFSFLFPRG